MALGTARAEPEACKKPANPKPACVKASEAYAAFMGCWKSEYQRVAALPTHRMDLNFCCSAQEQASMETRCHGYAKIKTTNMATASLGNPCFQKFVDFSRSLPLCP
jgi:hypothetical protein